MLSSLKSDARRDGRVAHLHVTRRLRESRGTQSALWRNGRANRGRASIGTDFQPCVGCCNRFPTPFRIAGMSLQMTGAYGNKLGGLSMKRRHINNRGTHDAFGLILVIAFGAMAILSAGVTFLALRGGQSSEIIKLCLIATGSWTVLWTVINALRERTRSSY